MLARCTTVLLLAALASSRAHAQQRPAQEQSSTKPADDAIWGYGERGGPWPGFDALREAAPIVPDDWLVVAKTARTTEGAIFARHLLDPRLAPPRASREVPDTGDIPWTRWKGSDPSNVLCAYACVRAASDEVRMLQLESASHAFVNGEGFVGDVNCFGFRGVPVALKAGDNHVFVFGIRDSFHLELWTPTSRMVIADWDARWPADDPMGVLWSPVWNAAPEAVQSLHVHYGHAVPVRRCAPRIKEWQDGGKFSIAPLGLQFVGTFATGWSDGCGYSSTEDIAAPVCVWEPTDVNAGRALVHRSNAEANRRVNHRTGAALASALYGLFAQPVRHVALVYGTAGAPNETIARLALARFDQQRIWYATGMIPLLLDDATFLDRLESTMPVTTGPRTDFDEPLFMGAMHHTFLDGVHVVLYGNADTNHAWTKIVPENARAIAKRGAARIGDRVIRRDDVSGWFVDRRADDPSGFGRVIGIVDTGMRGVRLGYVVRALTKARCDRDFALYDSTELAQGRLRVLASGSLR